VVFGDGQGFPDCAISNVDTYRRTETASSSLLGSGITRTSLRT